MDCPRTSPLELPKKGTRGSTPLDSHRFVSLCYRGSTCDKLSGGVAIFFENRTAYKVYRTIQRFTVMLFYYISLYQYHCRIPCGIPLSSEFEQVEFNGVKIRHLDLLCLPFSAMQCILHCSERFKVTALVKQYKVFAELFSKSDRISYRPPTVSLYASLVAPASLTERM